MDLLKQAVSINQYNSEDMDWESEGDANSPARQLIRRAIKLQTDEVKGKVVLDVGCGSGWFLKECLQKGATEVVGIEPSRFAEVAVRQVPAAKIFQTTFEDYEERQGCFDMVVFIMSTEHIADITQCMSKIFNILKSSGEALIVTVDFETFQTERYGNRKIIEVLSKGREVVVRTERPGGYGTTIDIARSNDYWRELAKENNFWLLEDKKILIDEEYVRMDSKKAQSINEPILHLFKLVKNVRSEQ